MLRRLPLIAIAALLSAGTARAEVIVQSFDDGRADRWEPISGAWAVEDGAYLQTDASSPEYRYARFDRPWRTGTLTVTATPLERNPNGNVGASFGVVVKHLAEDRWCIARFGSYGACTLLISEPEGRRAVRIGRFSPTPGQQYRVRVIVRDGMIALARDGLVTAILQDPFPGETGRPGLFTETRCRFDDVRIEIGEE